MMLPFDGEPALAANRPGGSARARDFPVRVLLSTKRAAEGATGQLSIQGPTKRRAGNGPKNLKLVRSQGHATGVSIVNRECPDSLAIVTIA